MGGAGVPAVALSAEPAAGVPAWAVPAPVVSQGWGTSPSLSPVSFGMVRSGRPLKSFVTSGGAVVLVGLFSGSVRVIRAKYTPTP